MKKAEKPEFTDEMRAKLNSMVQLLYKRFYTKQELMEIYNVGERQIRMMITAISHRLPVMSTSGTNNGYKIATSPEELELVEKLMGGAFKPYRRASEAHIALNQIQRQNKIRSKLK